MWSRKLKQLYADLRNLKTLCGLPLEVYKHDEGVLIADDRKIWCLITECGPAWNLSFNEFCSRNDRMLLLSALRRLTGHERMIVGGNCVFIGLEVNA